MPFAPSSFLLLVARPGALVGSLHVLALVAMPFAPSSFLLLQGQEPLIASLHVLAPSSDM